MFYNVLTQSNYVDYIDCSLCIENLKICIKKNNVIFKLSAEDPGGHVTIKLLMLSVPTAL